MITKTSQERLKHFKNEVLNTFAFLADYGYELKDNEIGQDPTYLDYFSRISFSKGTREIYLSYNTDIINGMIAAYPELKKKPEIDDMISVSIYDENALLIVDIFIQEMHKEIDPAEFKIPLASPNVTQDITRVLNNHKNFLITNLKDVIEGKKMYNCYMNKDYQIVIQELT